MSVSAVGRASIRRAALPVGRARRRHRRRRSRQLAEEHRVEACCRRSRISAWSSRSSRAATTESVPGMIEIAAAVLPGRSLIAAVRPHLHVLVKATGEAAGLSIADGFDMLYLDQVDADNQVQIRDWTGERLARPHRLVRSGAAGLRGHRRRQLSRPAARTNGQSAR